MLEIETERLVLRMFVPEDAGDLHRIWNDPDVMRYIKPDWKPTLEDVRDLMEKLLNRWRESGFGQLAVVPHGHKNLIGYCGFKYLDGTSEVELLYGIEKDYWRRGITTEAARACLKYVFDETKLDRIVAVVRPENRGSWGVMEKLGMKFEGMGRYYNLDLKYYSMMREDFRPVEAAYILRKR